MNQEIQLDSTLKNLKKNDNKKKPFPIDSKIWQRWPIKNISQKRPDTSFVKKIEIKTRKSFFKKIKIKEERTARRIQTRRSPWPREPKKTKQKKIDDNDDDDYRDDDGDHRHHHHHRHRRMPRFISNLLFRFVLLFFFSFLFFLAQRRP